ncbi:PIN domain-containing protein [Limnohabitans sp. Rim8]|jgi:predicted nucleic acid-binding protein|uniref:type II toxin-antitoxin system VapC family toxin n=1 Tax=Limnohabitans sp. Rim8 TaxID=1100718 RepID=UPI0033061725
MILVDSSVWIDYFRGERNLQTEQLDLLLEHGEGEVGVADLVVFEVLRGFTSPRAQQAAKAMLLSITLLEIGGLSNALNAVVLYRRLRQSGRTVHSPIDVLLASYCITHGHALLHRDADFESLKTLGGLDTWPH